MEYSFYCFTPTFSVVTETTKKILRYFVWVRSYTSSVWLILLFCPFTVGLKSAYASNSFSKEERERCGNHQQDYAKMLKNTSV